MITSFLLAMRALSRNGVRSGLTILGILVGVASLVAVTTLGAGVKARVSGSMEELASNVFTVTSRPPPTGARKNLYRPLTEGDARQIIRDLRSVRDVVPVSSKSIEVIYMDRSAPVTAFGTTLSYFSVRSQRTGKGVLWTPMEQSRREKVCVLGSGLADTLFRGSDPVGRTVRVKGFPCRVVGVLSAQSEAAGDGEDLSNAVFLPIGSFRARIYAPPGDGVDYLMVAAAGGTERAKADVTTLLKQRHRIPAKGEPDFSVSAADQLQQIQVIIAGALSALLLCVASVSLVVGGIGVMNIMLVSVAERKREIGIRISIGATSNDILTQFLIEAIVLTSLGGLSGMALGWLGSVGIGKLVHLPLRPNPLIASGAVITSALIGVLFGYLPARRAAMLDPIQALRTD